MKRDSWMHGGEPARRCGRYFALPGGNRQHCTAPVFVVHFAHKVLGTVARYVCVNRRCTRYDEATALRWNR